MAEAGLREIVLVFEELGRASCPAPLLGAVAANLALGDAAIERGARAARRLAPGQGHGCAGARRLRWRSGRRPGGDARRHAVGQACVCRRRADGDAFRGLHRRPRRRGGRKRRAGLDDARPRPASPCRRSASSRFENTPAIAVGRAARNAGRHRAGGAARLCRPGARRGAARVRTGRRSRQDQKAVRPVHRPVPGGPAQARQLPDQPRRRAADARNGGRGARQRQSGLADLRRRRRSRSPVRRCATVSIETHRALGAIGYAEEHEAPRHFRRVHADLARFGGVPRARAELADFLLGPVAA